MQGWEYTQAGPAYINGTAFPSSLYTITNQDMMTTQSTPQMAQPTSPIVQPEVVDLPPPYGKENAI